MVKFPTPKPADHPFPMTEDEYWFIMMVLLMRRFHLNIPRKVSMRAYDTLVREQFALTGIAEPIDVMELKE